MLHCAQRLETLVDRRFDGGVRNARGKSGYHHGRRIRIVPFGSAFPGPAAGSLLRAQKLGHKLSFGFKSVRGRVVRTAFVGEQSKRLTVHIGSRNVGRRHRLHELRCFLCSADGRERQDEALQIGGFGRTVRRFRIRHERRHVNRRHTTGGRELKGFPFLGRTRIGTGDGAEQRVVRSAVYCDGIVGRLIRFGFGLGIGLDRPRQGVVDGVDRELRNLLVVGERRVGRVDVLVAAVLLQLRRQLGAGVVRAVAVEHRRPIGPRAVGLLDRLVAAERRGAPGVEVRLVVPLGLLRAGRGGEARLRQQVGNRVVGGHAVDLAVVQDAVRGVGRVHDGELHRKSGSLLVVGERRVGRVDVLVAAVLLQLRRQLGAGVVRAVAVEHRRPIGPRAVGLLDRLVAAERRGAPGVEVRLVVPLGLLRAGRGGEARLRQQVGNRVVGGHAVDLAVVQDAVRGVGRVHDGERHRERPRTLAFFGPGCAGHEAQAERGGQQEGPRPPHDPRRDDRLFLHRLPSPFIGRFAEERQQNKRLRGPRDSRGPRSPYSLRRQAEGFLALRVAFAVTRRLRTHASRSVFWLIGKAETQWRYRAGFSPGFPRSETSSSCLMHSTTSWVDERRERGATSELAARRPPTGSAATPPGRAWRRGVPGSSRTRRR